MAYKIYQELESGMAGKGLLKTTAIDDAALGKTQAELNNLFNQGKNKNGVQIGKTYEAAKDGGLLLSGNSFALSPEVKAELAAKHVTLAYGQNEDAITLALMRHNMILNSIKTQGVTSVDISYGDRISEGIYPLFPSEGVDMGEADFMVVKIIREADNADAVVGLTFKVLR